VGPIVVVDEFVFGERPGLEDFAHLGRDAGVIGEGPHEAFLVAFVGFPDFFAGGVVGFGVVVVLADVVG